MDINRKKRQKFCRLCGFMLAVCTAFCGCGSGGGSNASGGSESDISGGKSTSSESVVVNSTSAEEDRIMTDHAVYDGVELPDSLWQSVPTYYEDSENDRTEKGTKGTIKAIYYRSDYNGTESYAFAYLGIPEDASASEKKPAVLLVHGGGGTAYWQWVQMWVNRGYVALAMDLEGHVPKKEGTSDDVPANLYTNSPYTTPHNQNYGDAELPIEQTWMYYAVSTAISGNTLLHSLDFVNTNKVGVCGVSWGGVIASIITGYDDRFAFSIPIYCSLNLAECRGGNLTSYYRSHAAARVWDDDEGLSRVDTPILFLAMNDDLNALPDSISYTAERCKNATVSLVRGWLHSHSHAFARLEPYAFADSIVNGEQIVKIESQPSGTEGKISVSIPEGKRVKAYIACTSDDMSGVPSWTHERLLVENGEIAYKVEDDTTTYYYIWLEESAGTVVSSNLVSLAL